MHDYMRDLLHRSRYSEELKEAAGFRIRVGAEAPNRSRRVWTSTTVTTAE